MEAAPEKRAGMDLDVEATVATVAAPPTVVENPFDAALASEQQAKNTAKAEDKKPAVSFAPVPAAATAEATASSNASSADSARQVKHNDASSFSFQTPLPKQKATAAVSTAGTAATDASTVASSASVLTTPSPPPPGTSSGYISMQPSNLTSQFTSPTPNNTASNRSSSNNLQQGKFGFASPPARTTTAALVVAPPTPKKNEVQQVNEFQQVTLRKSTKMVEKHMKESKLEFAEMIANALNSSNNSNSNNTGDNSSSNLEVLRHMDDLKTEVALLNSENEEDETLWAINRLRQELLDMFNQSGPMDEQYLLRWILPLHRERDPQTGRLTMSADQVALLQSFSTSEELDQVAGLGMVRSVLQSNFKAINGADCLTAIHDYASFRLGKKSKRAPQNPWDLLAHLFEKAQLDDSTEDIHQRVCNALVQWVVREILGTTKDKVSSRSCFHAIFLVSSLKLELQRLAPKAIMDQSASVEMLEDGDDSAMARANKPSGRAPIVEKLLQSNIFSDEPQQSPSSSSLPSYKNPDTVIESKSTATPSLSDEQRVSKAVISYDPSTVQDSSNTADEDERMRAAMIIRDNGRKELSSCTKEEERTLESELPRSVQDSHRVIRTILGPDHEHINVSHCFEAIRLYSSLIMEWKEVSELNELQLETNSVASKPTLEEEKLKMLEHALRPKRIEPPLAHIQIEEKRKAAVVSGENAQVAAQLGTAALKNEEPTPVSLPKSPKKEVPMPTDATPTEGQKAQKAVREKVQKSAEANQVQAKTRTRLLSKLKRLKLSNRSSKSKQRNSAALASAISPSNDSRDAKKRRPMWKKFLGISVDHGSQAKTNDTTYQVVKEVEL